ncbi:MAG: radical SAM protein [Thermoplasmata archaeon HGW-Thermoplasmata-1]|nr:MAG: radical SAM protein [Thermoplasmata archaeon HGW-Thermoplasmata-1]
MKIIGEYGKDELAILYVADMRNDGEHIVEFVESIQPPFTREEKWVQIVSTLYGCPAGCAMCDAGGGYRGKLTANEMLSQILYMVKRRYPDGRVPAKKFKIQFARMGEPALNPAVLDALELLPFEIDAPGLIPSVSTIAPHGADAFFERLLEIKRRLYPAGMFQLQFSIHTTDEGKRDEIIPIKKWDFAKIAEYGARFRENGDRKITLNFAPARDYPIDVGILKRYFDPSIFLIKLTPLNPTKKVAEKSLESLVDGCMSDGGIGKLTDELKAAGYDVILSIGELEENQIGSNCGQYATEHFDGVKLELRKEYPTADYTR